ncbi:unnamed protein product [Angiostrongylus costaricensis]|uniref:40S ribosomal protein S30 n=1 Tax=Angiostrongylus costaricensis TaxID=334426 RepID=A0A0R3PIT4_ANGCS|nr:unnamed protein product [Angiostrongylus costaricensis]
MTPKTRRPSLLLQMKCVPKFGRIIVKRTKMLKRHGKVKTTSKPRPVSADFLRINDCWKENGERDGTRHSVDGRVAPDDKAKVSAALVV